MLQKITYTDCAKEIKGLSISAVGGLLMIGGSILWIIGELKADKAIVRTIFIDENGNQV